MTDRAPALHAGMAVTPNVRLVRALGSGGMGAVWLAEHAGLATKVVVKFMLAGVDGTPSARARFSREAAAAAQVKSPHVVQMLDHGVTEQGLPFIVMEHLEGRDLGAVLKERGLLDPAEVLAIVTQIAKALQRVHAAGLLHRDIKPDNIFVCDGDDELFVKLLDFGIAKRGVRDGDDDASLDGSTNTGQVVGTPYYMSPEQVTAQKTLDARSDLWSLGVVAFEALTGARPFDGPSFGALAVTIATGTPPRPSDVKAGLPPEIDAWFAKACAREPSARFASAKELAEALRIALGGAPGPMSDSGQRRPALTSDPPGASTSATPSFENAATLVGVDDATPAPLGATGSAVVDAGARDRDEARARKRWHVVLAVVGALSGAVIVTFVVGRQPPRVVAPAPSPRGAAPDGTETSTAHAAAPTPASADGELPAKVEAASVVPVASAASAASAAPPVSASIPARAPVQPSRSGVASPVLAAAHARGPVASDVQTATPVAADAGATPAKPLRPTHSHDDPLY